MKNKLEFVIQEILFSVSEFSVTMAGYREPGVEILAGTYELIDEQLRPLARFQITGEDRFRRGFSERAVSVTVTDKDAIQAIKKHRANLLLSPGSWSLIHIAD